MGVALSSFFFCWGGAGLNSQCRARSRQRDDGQGMAQRPSGVENGHIEAPEKDELV